MSGTHLRDEPNIVAQPDLIDADIGAAPVILQEALIPKVDIRVTIVGDILFAVGIYRRGEGVYGDWRCAKNDVEYQVIKLPADIETKCRILVKELDLKFGAIDLALSRGTYYFLEINPTGEWAWLMEQTHLRIDAAIAGLLSEATSS